MVRDLGYTNSDARPLRGRTHRLCFSVGIVRRAELNVGNAAPPQIHRVMILRRRPALTVIRIDRHGSCSREVQGDLNMLAMTVFTPIVAAAGWSLLYLLMGGGLFGALVIFVVLKLFRK